MKKATLVLSSVVATVFIILGLFFLVPAVTPKADIWFEYEYNEEKNTLEVDVILESACRYTIKSCEIFVDVPVGDHRTYSQNVKFKDTVKGRKTITFSMDKKNIQYVCYSGYILKVYNDDDVALSVALLCVGCAFAAFAILEGVMQYRAAKKSGQYA